MHTLVKAAISLLIILIATAIGKRFPSAAGLVAVMPLAGALVLVWVYVESSGDAKVMKDFSKGALWGFIPSLMFYLTAFFCFRKQLPLSVTLISSLGVWFAAAVIHQLLLR